MTARSSLLSKITQGVAAEAKSSTVSESDVFLRLPKVLEEKILSFFPLTANDGKKKLSSVNRRLNALFKPNLLGDRVVCSDRKAVESILKHAALQDTKQQKALNTKKVKEVPHALRDLLLKKIKVVDYSGRIIIGTPLQLAWGAEDPEMINAIQQALLMLPDGKDIIKEQYAEQFPQDWQEIEEKEWAPIQQAMRDAFVAIEHGQDADVTYANQQITIRNEAIKKSVDHFRTLLSEHMKKPITKGRHFNPALLLECAEICDNDDRWVERGGCSDRNRLANCMLYGFIQRYLPSRSMKATAQGLYHVMGDAYWNEFKPEPIQDSFKYRSEPSVFAYPLNSDSGWILGENCFCGSRGERDGSFRPWVTWAFWQSTTADLKILRDLGQLTPKTLNYCALL